MLPSASRLDQPLSPCAWPGSATARTPARFSPPAAYASVPRRLPRSSSAQPSDARRSWPRVRVCWCWPRCAPPASRPPSSAPPPASWAPRSHRRRPPRPPRLPPSCRPAHAARRPAPQPGPGPGPGRGPGPDPDLGLCRPDLDLGLCRRTWICRAPIRQNSRPSGSVSGPELSRFPDQPEVRTLASQPCSTAPSCCDSRHRPWRNQRLSLVEGGPCDA
mmetsp:Transcript_82237/g.236349  ORF Transcript_82237/g.236349 Transcript_82237/m.236349 type:complete len:218 (+) Transcript_82237:387-1040(+)